VRDVMQPCPTFARAATATGLSLAGASGTLHFTVFMTHPKISPSLSTSSPMVSCSCSYRGSNCRQCFNEPHRHFPALQKPLRRRSSRIRFESPLHTPPKLPQFRRSHLPRRSILTETPSCARLLQSTTKRSIVVEDHHEYQS
jgi:hypothetical protein